MDFKHRVFSAPTGCPPCNASLPRQQRSHQKPYQPVYVIPLGAATAPVEPIIVEPASNTRPASYPLVPTIAPKLDALVASSSGAVKGRRPLFPLDDREMRRRVKKQNMERRRRACISDKLAALHSLAVSLVGEEVARQPDPVWLMYPLGLAPYKKAPSDLVLCWASTGAWIEVRPGILIFRTRRQGVNAFQYRPPARVSALTCDQMHHHHNDWLVDWVTSAVSWEPQQRSQQRTEITDILNQCVRVLQGLSELVKSEPELQLKLRRLELPSPKESLEKQRRRKQISTSILKGKVMEKEKENESPHASGLKAVDRNRRATTTTPLATPPLLSTPSHQQHECPLKAGCRKRESTDSGLDCHTFPSPEAVTVSSPFAPSTSSSSLVKTQSLKRFQKSSPDIWRPYL
ncbi:hypothetical protein TSMEX_000152 [Taenia solium]